jgi:hypothetical protein
MMTRGTATDAIGAVAAGKSCVVKEFSPQRHAFLGHGVVGRDVGDAGKIGWLRHIVRRWTIMIVFRLA